MDTKVLYEKSLRAFLLTKYTTAASHCLKALASIQQQQDNVDDTLKLNIWTLYLNIASTLTIGKSMNTKVLGIESSMDSLTRNIWDKIVQEGFGNAALVDPKLVSACLILGIKLTQENTARDIAEEWFTATENQLESGYFQVVEIYTTRILTSLHDFDSATAFLKHKCNLPDSDKKLLKRSIKEQHPAYKVKEGKRRKPKEKEEEQVEKLQVGENTTTQNTDEDKDKAVTSDNRKGKSFNVRKWLHQIPAKGVTVILFIFTLITLLRGQRGRLSRALQHSINKLWNILKFRKSIHYS